MILRAIALALLAFLFYQFGVIRGTRQERARQRAEQAFLCDRIVGEVTDTQWLKIHP